MPSHTIAYLIPEALQELGPYAIFENGGFEPLSKLAYYAQSGRASDLSRAELAKLVEMFSAEPLPKPLRELVTGHLSGKLRAAKGRKTKPTTVNQSFMLGLLPSLYSQYLSEERAKHKQAKAGRLSEPPSAKAISRIKKAVPSLQHMSPESIKNLISKMKGEVTTGRRKKHAAAKLRVGKSRNASR